MTVVDVRPGHERALVLLLAGAAVTITATGIRVAAEIVAPVMLALVLTIAVLPIADWARRRGWPGWGGILLALVAACGILLVLLLGLVLAVVKLVDLVGSYEGRVAEVRADLTELLTDRGVATEQAGRAADEVEPAAVTDAFEGVLAGVLGDLFLLVTLLFFFCSALGLLGARVDALRRVKPQLTDSLGRFVRTTQRYLVVTALFGAIVAVLDTGALWLLGVPLPLVWGLFSFVTNFIPNIGFVVGVIPPTLLALLEHGWGRAVAVVVVYSLLNVVIQTFIQPRYVGASVGLSAEVTFLSLVVWTFLLGPLGALLAVPMTLLIRALLLDPDPRAAWMTPLISTRPDDAEP